jgi:hypothetical protein
MSPIRTLACICALAAPFFTFTDRASVVAAEKAAPTVTLGGRVDVAGLDVSAGLRAGYTPTYTDALNGGREWKSSGDVGVFLGYSWAPESGLRQRR